MEAIHPLLKDKIYSSWDELEAEISDVNNATEKGDVFEQFCYYYLLFYNDLYQIQELYSSKIPGKDIPISIIHKYKLSIKDDGVDGVIITTDEKCIAYQSKFRSGRTGITSNELNNFWAEAEYADFRLVISNVYQLPSDTEKRRNGLSALIDKFDNLNGIFFKYLYDSALKGSTLSTKHEKLTPKAFQKPIIESIVEGFSQVDRGKIIAACATGKTLISLWASEKLNTKSVLFFTPNLALVRQSIERWVYNTDHPFSYIAVCSDKTVGEGVDELAIKLSDMDVPVTTDSEDIVKFINSKIESKKVVFSTYQSADSISEALSFCKGFKFDLIIYDEAHRTAGSSEDGLFSNAVNEDFIPATKRLFMTATERLVKPWIKERFEQENRTVFSMDDEDKYGPTFYKLPFGEAISKGIIADYKIVIAATTNRNYEELIKTNRYLTAQLSNEDTIESIEAQQLFKAILLLKAIEETKVEKVVSFHSTIKEAVQFIKIIDGFPSEYVNEKFNLDAKNMKLLHVNGKMSSALRQKYFHEFENSKIALISNVRCMNEGVDIPYIDSILFASPKGSLIDIVQAVGRALRKPFDDTAKDAYIIVPILLNDDGTYEENAFTALHFVIQALRDQDDTLAEWIDQINLSVVRGFGRKGLKSASKFRLLLPHSIDLNQFAEFLAVRISEANSRPTGTSGIGSKLGKSQRVSDYKRIFKCIGDYNVNAYEDSLVKPTIELFDISTSTKERSELLISNNNVSHTERLGLIRIENPNTFRLTRLGKLYHESRLSFIEIFCNQMLLYKQIEDDAILYPYRAALKVIIAAKSLNYIEFLFSIYSLRAGQESIEVNKALEVISFIRTNYPNVMLTSQSNYDAIRSELNNMRNVEFSTRDVWTDRTTSGNQYRFFTNHILLLEGVFNYESKELTLLCGGEKTLNMVLVESQTVLDDLDYVYGDSIWVKKI